MTIVLRAGLLLNGRDRQPFHDHAVIVDDGRITAVGAADSIAYPPDAQVLSWSTGTILPGLIDLHAHPTYHYRRADAIGFAGNQFSDGLLALFGAWQLQHDLEAGVTTVRDAGSVNRLALDIERGRRKGFVRVPRVIGCGPLITPTGGHVHDRPGLTREADGADEVRRAVREEIKAGAQFIKLAINGADYLDRNPQLEAERVDRVTNGVDFSQEEIDVAVTEAHRAGLRVACHTRWRPSVLKAIRAQVDTIEHGTFMADDDLRAIADAGIVWVPTIYQGAAGIRLAKEEKAARQADRSELGRSAAFSEESLDCRRRLFGLALKLGVKIGAGTDIFRPDMNFAALLDELLMFVEFGMSPADAIQAATRGNAEALGWADRIGALEAGKTADLIVVEGNPLADLNVLRNPRLVMLEGEILVMR